MPFLRNIFRTLSQNEKRVLLAAGALIAIGAAGLIIFFIKNRTVAVPAHRGSYSEGMVGQPSYVNPVLAASDDDQGLVRLLFASLKDLSQNIETSSDGKTIKANLKQGLVWSDGEPITSDDVIFTLQSIQNPDSRSPLAGLFEGVKADRVSDFQVDFHLENTALSSAVLNMRPAPKHLYGDVPLGNWRLSTYNLNPISSGPYVFSTHDAGADGFITAYRLAANNSYAGTKPYIQKLNFLFFHNEQEVLAAFNSGQIQGFGTADPSLLDGIKRPYDLSRFTTPTVYAVFWNQTTNPALGPIEVRQALDLVTDRNRVLAALNGYGQVATGPLPPALLPPGESSEVQDAAASSSPATASSTAASSTPASASSDPARILEQNGWTKASDGIWEKKTAKTTVRLEFALTVPDISFLKEAAQDLASQWESFGAKVSLKVLPADSSLMATITNRGYDGLLFGNTVRGIGDLYPFWHSSERFAPGLNLAAYQNSRVDSLLEGIRRQGDPARRQNDLKAVSQLIKADQPAVFLFSIDNLYVSSKSLEGISGGFLENPADRLGQLSGWYVSTARRLK